MEAKRVADAFAAVGKGLKPIREELTQLKVRVESMGRQLDEIDTKITEVKQLIEGVEREIKTMKEKAR